MMLNFMNIHEMSRRHVTNMATSRFSNDLPSEFIQTNLHNKKTKEGTKCACNILKDFCAARGEVGGEIESLNEEYVCIRIYIYSFLIVTKNITNCRYLFINKMHNKPSM